MVRACLLLLLITSLTQGVAQPYPFPNRSAVNDQPITNQFEYLSVKNGLSNNSVTCILQDREGFMWIGTTDGLNKYDGHTVTILQHDPNSPDSSLHSNHVLDLHEDRSGKLWVTTVSGIMGGGGGLHQVNKRTGIATPVGIKVPSVEWTQTLVIHEDRQGILWIGSWAGLMRYNPKTGRYVLYPFPQINAEVICILEDTQNQFWVGGKKGLYRFDRRSGRFTLVPLQSAPAGYQPWVSTLYQDKAGNLWAGTNKDGLLQINPRGKPVGLFRYAARKPINRHIFTKAILESQDGHLLLGTAEGLQQVDTRTGEVITYQSNPGLLSGLSNDQVRVVYHDRSGTLWLGTDQGVNKQVGTSALFNTVQVVSASGADPPVENIVTALLEDRTGIIWIGSNYRKLYRYDPKQGRITFIPVDPANPESLAEQHQVETIYEDRTGQLWVGTLGGLLRMDRVTGAFVRYSTRIRRIRSIAEDPSGLLWLGGEGGIARLNPKTGQFRYHFYHPKDTTDRRGSVEHLMVSRAGHVWMAIRGIGISRLQPKTGRFTRHHPVLPAPAGQLNETYVTAFYEDTDGVVWIGTNKSGLNWYDPATGRFAALTTRHGLPDNHVSAIINDRHGHLWISTTRGICRFNRKTKTFHNYTTDDGLPHNWFRSRACHGRNGDLLFGSLNGVAIVHPDRIYSRAAFPVYISKFSVLDQNRPLTADRLKLRHDENFIAFEFVALSYQSPEKNQYAHQLVGVDKNWVYSGTRQFVSYTDLSPGTYTFRVKAANSDGVWNEKETAVQLLIQPPWWATWWAYSLYALLVGGAIWGYIRVYTNRVRQQQALELNRREAQQLKAVDELKTRFFSNITHEFRTPLSLIISPVEKLLQENQVNGPTRRTLALVQRNADQLLRLINQLLDLSKLEANHMLVSLMRGGVTEFVSHLVESFHQLAEQKGVRLTYTYIGEGSAHEYLFDADKWEKILTNLLSNALKFTGSGGHVTVTLTVDPAPAVSDGFSVSIRIADSGIGITPEDLPHIFNRFYQVDTSHTRAYEGTGIGLALVKELIDLVGGAISVDSQPGVGSTFVATLPVQPASVNTESPKVVLSGKKSALLTQLPALDLSGNQPIENGQTPLLLIVEDNAELRDFLADSLSATYRVLQAADGEAGWHLTQTELPDIVVSDVMMPRMDGYELTHRIKNHSDTDHIAVIILSAKAAHSSRIEGLQEGADDYIPKPFHLDELHLRLRNLMIRQQNLRDQYRQQFTQPDMPSPINRVDDVFLRRVYELLESHLNDPLLTVDWLADELAMSRKTLYRKVHSLVQLNPHELIRHYRLRKAADLLRAGHTPSQTAHLTGFKTPSYFTLVFKEFYHKTPTEFAAGGLSKA
ncbi:hybrid sensor histidine kinase/response regulator transcription factor [Spirosoma arcticum]